MAELRFKILGDLKQLRADVRKMFSERFKINAEVPSTGAGGAGGAAGSSKKTNSLLGTIIKSLAPIGVLMSLKPIKDAIEILKGFVVLGIIKIWELLKGIVNTVIEGWSKMVDGFKSLWNYLKGVFPIVKQKLIELKDKLVRTFQTAINFLKTLPSKIWDFLKSLPEKIWGFLKGLGSIIWEYLKEGFNIVREKLSSLWNVIKEKFSSVISFFSKLWNGLKEWFSKLVGWIKNLPKNLWDNLKKGFEWIKSLLNSVWETLKDLPSNLWDKIKELSTLIAKAIKGVVKGLNPFSRSETVGDAIIKPDGRVIRTNPNDTIIATQNPGSGGGKNVTLNFYGVTPQEMIDHLRRELGISNLRSSRF